MGAATVGPFDPRIVQHRSPFRLFFRKITKFGAVGFEVIKLPLPFISGNQFPFAFTYRAVPLMFPEYLRVGRAGFPVEDGKEAFPRGFRECPAPRAAPRQLDRALATRADHAHDCRTPPGAIAVAVLRGAPSSTPFR